MTQTTVQSALAGVSFVQLALGIAYTVSRWMQR